MLVCILVFITISISQSNANLLRLPVVFKTYFVVILSTNDAFQICNKNVEGKLRTHVALALHHGFVVGKGLLVRVVLYTLDKLLELFLIPQVFKCCW